MKKKDLSWRHILVTDMSLELLSFLIEKNVLTEFMNNALKNSDPSEIGRNFSEYFVWSDTPEGYRFWNRLYTNYGFCWLPKYYKKQIGLWQQQV